MTDVLIINLRRHGDLFSSAHLVNSIMHTNSQVKIHLLVYEEFKQSADIISKVYRNPCN